MQGGSRVPRRARTLPSRIAVLCAAPFDLLIVGAGIHGAFAAWDAAMRGLRVALIDRGDFGAEASGNSLRILHGGIRYLQSGDVTRLRETAREQRILWRMAPHLVRALPCVVPSRPGITRGRLALRAAIEAHALLTGASSRSAGGPVPPPGRMLSADEYAYLAGPLAAPDADGGALWYDGELTSSDRFLIGVVRSAEREGALALNYVSATALLHDGSRVTGVRVEDDEGNTGEVIARAVLLAAGAGSRSLVPCPSRLPPFALAVNVVLRTPPARAAVAIAAPGGSRLLFAVPWGEELVLGTAQDEAPRNGDRASVDRAAASLLDALALVHPDAACGPDDVRLVQYGLLPGTPERLLDRPVIVDHAACDGVPGLVTLIGVKWTTARRDAERAIDACARALNRPLPRGRTAGAVIVGAQPEGRRLPPGEGASARPARGARAGLLARYGTTACEVMSFVQMDPALGRAIDGSETLAAEVVHAIRVEHALHLDDVVRRRTALGATGHPGRRAVHEAARVAARELRWSEARIAAEIARVEEAFAHEWGDVADEALRA